MAGWPLQAMAGETRYATITEWRCRVQDPAAQAHDAIHDEGQRRAALLLRTLPVLLIPAAAVLTVWLVMRLVGGEPAPPPMPLPMPPPPRDAMPPPSPVPMLVVMVGLPLLLSAILFRVIRAGRTTVPALALIGMWTLVYTVGALSSGVMSFWPASLVVPICAAALLLGSRAGMAIAGLATLLVVSSAWLEVHGLRFPLGFGPFGPFLGRPVPPPIGDPPPGFPLAAPMLAVPLVLAVGYWVGLFWTVAVLTSLLAGSLQRALQRSRAQARALTELSAGLEDRVAAQTAALLVQEREAAVMEERTRLARDIHDALAQNLTGIIVQLGAVQRALAVAPTQVDEHLDLAQRMARESLAEARRSVWNLRAPALERGDLGDALRGLAARPLSAETTASFEQEGEPRPLPASVEVALLRVCQEALANVVRHAQATRVAVTLVYEPDAVRLIVRDNGAGFREAVVRERTSGAGPWSGFGLLGMRERLGALGGTLTLTSCGGAEVVATVPRDAVPAAGPDASPRPAATGPSAARP
jgi:signal transduction histidine kinase